MRAQPNSKRDWFAEFRRRRMFRAMVAYFVGAWLLLQIASVTFPPLGLPEWMQRALIIALAVGIVERGDGFVGKVCDGSFEGGEPFFAGGWIACEIIFAWFELDFAE